MFIQAVYKIIMLGFHTDYFIEEKNFKMIKSRYTNQALTNQFLSDVRSHTRVLHYWFVIVLTY